MIGPGQEIPKTARQGKGRADASSETIVGFETSTQTGEPIGREKKSRKQKPPTPNSSSER